VNISESWQLNISLILGKMNLTFFLIKVQFSSIARIKQKKPDNWPEKHNISKRVPRDHI